MRVNNKRIVAIPTHGGTLVAAETALPFGAFLRVSKRCLNRGVLQGITLPHLKRWLALARQDLYWMRPHWGITEQEVPRETQFFLWQRTDGLCGIFLPLLAGDVRATLAGGADGLTLVFDGALPGQEQPDGILAFVGAAKDPYELIRAAMAAVARHMHSFRLADEKYTPEFVRHLGWCTWDAFYHAVDETKVLAGLRSFKRGGVTPGFMILDDGWLDTTGDLLNSFAANKKKFPAGLGRLVQHAKKNFGITMFGIWHAFEGYWAGLNPRGELARHYRLIHNRGKIRPWLGTNDKELDLHLLDPRDVARFYHDFYRVLRQQGVAMVKVDGQSALEVFCKDKLGRAGTMRVFQEALQGAAHLRFKNNMIHCMSNGADVAYNMDASLVWRNSQDYLPKCPADIQCAHLVINAFNNVWTSTFALPDWDMFQTHGPAPEYHAAARAISGGPIYVCDQPGRQNFAILRKLTVNGSEVLRCLSPALPARDCLFVNFWTKKKLLKIANCAGGAQVLGLFHCHANGPNMTGSFAPRDAARDARGPYAVYLHNRRELAVLEAQQRMAVTLAPLQFEIATIAAVAAPAVPLGLLDKYMGAAAVLRAGPCADETFVCELAGGGVAGFYCAKKPKHASADGQPVVLHYAGKSGLLSLVIPDNQHRPCVTLHF